MPVERTSFPSGDTTPPSVTVVLVNDTGQSNTDHATSDPTVAGQATDTGTGITSFRAGFDLTSEVDFVEVSGDLAADGSFTFGAGGSSRSCAARSWTGRTSFTCWPGMVPAIRQPLPWRSRSTPHRPRSRPSTCRTLRTGNPADHTTDDVRVTLTGETEAGALVALLGTNVTALGSMSGSFQFPSTALALGDTTFTAQAIDAAGNTASIELTVRRVAAIGGPDPVLQWNQIALAAIALDASDPPTSTRGLAMVHSAVYDALNAVEGNPGHFVALAAPVGSSVEAAVVQAAHDVLVYLFPGQQATFDSNLADGARLDPRRPGPDRRPRRRAVRRQRDHRPAFRRRLG